jgi:spermidine/putrescine transport system substrate-binding protein
MINSSYNRTVSFVVKVGIVIFWLLVMYLGIFYRFGLDLVAAKKDGLNIFTFTRMIDSEVIARFSEQSGIPVRVTYFETNEELIAKFKVTRGEGYDLVVVSDYALEILRDEGLLQEIDIRKISNVSKLDERLLNRHFDPGNNYALPLLWTVYVLAYNKSYFSKGMPSSLRVLFEDPKKNELLPPYRIAMLDDPREAVFCAGLYLFGKTHGFSESELKEIEVLLSKQKQWVENYANDAIEYALAARRVPLVIIPAAHMIKNFDLGREFDILFPEEGTLLSIEHMAIPKASVQSDLVHRFIDFVLSTPSAIVGSAQNGYSPSNKEVYDHLVGDNKKYLLMLAQDSVLSGADTLRNDISAGGLEHMWLTVKSS